MIPISRFALFPEPGKVISSIGKSRPSKCTRLSKNGKSVDDIKVGAHILNDRPKMGKIDISFGLERSVVSLMWAGLGGGDVPSLRYKLSPWADMPTPSRVAREKSFSK